MRGAVPVARTPVTAVRSPSPAIVPPQPQPQPRRGLISRLRGKAAGAPPARTAAPAPPRVGVARMPAAAAPASEPDTGPPRLASVAAQPAGDDVTTGAVTTITFAPPAPLARTPDDAPAAAPAPAAPVGAPAAPATTVGAPAAPGAPAPLDSEAIYEDVVSRLRRELLVDRERMGDVLGGLN
jgi:hypothetical protein